MLVVHFPVYSFFRERDELLVALRAVRASQQEAQQREWSACLQVKQAVEMAEEANLYKARVRETIFQRRCCLKLYVLICKALLFR